MSVYFWQGIWLSKSCVWSQILDQTDLLMGGDYPAGFHLCFMQMLWFCGSLSGHDHQCALQLSVERV